jgi:hypothetical protein
MKEITDMASWLTEGTAHRSPVQRTPVIHLLVDEGGEWRMWCSYGKGREDNPHGNRLCRLCQQLARDAFAAGDVNVDDVRRWLAEAQVSAGA